MLAVSPAGAERKRRRNRRERKRILFEQSCLSRLHPSSICSRGLPWANGVPRRSEQSSDKSNRKRKSRSRDTEEEYLSYRTAGRVEARRRTHFEVFFTAINNPERTSFRELTQASCERGRIEVRRAIAALSCLYQPSLFLLALSCASSLSLASPDLSLSNIYLEAVSTAGAHGLRRHLHDLFRDPEK